MEKKSGKKLSRLQNGAIRGLKIGASLGISNRGKKKYKSGKGFQIGAKRFQIGSEITNRGKKDFKSGHGL